MDVKPYRLQSAFRGVQLRRRRLNYTQVHRLAIRQIIHRALGNIEPASGRVNRGYLYGCTIKSQIPACPAIGRVEAGNGLSTAKEGESRERAKRREVAREEAV